jgi:hypothetical protein
MIPINERDHATGKYFTGPNLQMEQIEKEIDKKMKRRRYSTPGGNLYDPLNAPINSEQIEVMFDDNHKTGSRRHMSTYAQMDLALDTEPADIQLEQPQSTDIQLEHLQSPDFEFNQYHSPDIDCEVPDDEPPISESKKFNFFPKNGPMLPSDGIKIPLDNIDSDENTGMTKKTPSNAFGQKTIQDNQMKEGKIKPSEIKFDFFKDAQTFEEEDETRRFRDEDAQEPEGPFDEIDVNVLITFLQLNLFLRKFFKKEFLCEFNRIGRMLSLSEVLWKKIRTCIIPFIFETLEFFADNQGKYQDSDFLPRELFDFTPEDKIFNLHNFLLETPLTDIQKKQFFLELCFGALLNFNQATSVIFPKKILEGMETVCETVRDYLLGSNFAVLPAYEPPLLKTEL